MSGGRNPGNNRGILVSLGSKAPVVDHTVKSPSSASNTEKTPTRPVSHIAHQDDTVIIENSTPSAAPANSGFSLGNLGKFSLNEFGRSFASLLDHDKVTSFGLGMDIKQFRRP